MKIKITKLLAAAIAVVALAAESAVVRKLPEMTVVESETVSTDAMKATSVRSSNASVFGAALREIFDARYRGACRPSAGGLARYFLETPSALVAEPLPLYLNPAVRD